jgi:cell fate (sporulation/competence/biofilm development) regulator YlbF (YheA/YmcA/DUF963 family)
MNMSDELKQAARAFGESLRQHASVQAYLQAQARLEVDPEARDLEERFSAMFQNLSSRQRAGENLSPAEVDEFYALRNQAQANHLISERDMALNLVKGYFVEVGSDLNRAVGINYVTLAKGN